MDPLDPDPDAFRKAEANFMLSDFKWQDISHYQVMKTLILAGKMDFERAIQLAAEHHREMLPPGLHRTRNCPEPESTIGSGEGHCSNKRTRMQSLRVKRNDRA